MLKPGRHKEIIEILWLILEIILELYGVHLSFQFITQQGLLSPSFPPIFSVTVTLCLFLFPVHSGLSPCSSESLL